MKKRGLNIKCQGTSKFSPWEDEKDLAKETKRDGQWIGGESRVVSQGQMQKDFQGGVSDQLA